MTAPAAQTPQGRGGILIYWETLAALTLSYLAVWLWHAVTRGDPWASWSFLVGAGLWGLLAVWARASRTRWVPVRVERS